VDNTTAAGGNKDDRIANASAITLAGGTFLYKGSDAVATNSAESVGAITAGPGVVTLTYGGTNTATLTAASFTHANYASTPLVNGVNLGKDTASTASVSRFILTTAPTLTGTTAALATGINSGVYNTKIVPLLLGEAAITAGGLGTATGTANTFLTYNATTGLRPLNPTDEFANNAVTSGNNIYITTSTTTSGTMSINSLVINGGNLTISSGQTLTNTSSALLFASTNTVDGAGNYTSVSENQISVNSGITGTIGAAITGTQFFTKSGAGTLVLSGINTYSGTTTVNSGTLTLTGNNSSAGLTNLNNPGVTLILGGVNNGGMASGNLTLTNGTFVQAQTQAATLTNNFILQNANNTFSGSQNISTSGNVTFTQGTGTTLTNNIAGTLTLGTTGSNLYLANAPTGQVRTIAGTGNTILAGNIINSTVASTASGLTITNTGVTTLSGTNTYTGNTTVSAGILTFLNTNAKSASAVTAGAAGSIGLGVATSGSFYTSADVDSLFANTLSGFTMNAASGVAIDTSAGNFTYATSQNATRSLTKLGANTLTLTGANTYTGATTVNVGTLIINGSTGASAFTVNNSGTLGGSGTIGGSVTVNSGGTLSPGNSPGLLTIGGPLTLAGNVNMEVGTGARGTNYDAVNLGASQLLTYGGTLTLTMTGAVANSTYNLFSFTSGFKTGDFASIAFAGGYFSGTWNRTADLWTSSLTQGQTFTFDQATGDLVAAVPEPATWALLAFSLTVVLVMRRRRC